MKTWLTPRKGFLIRRIFWTVSPISVALAICVATAVYIPWVRGPLDAARDEYGKLFWGTLVASSIMATIFTSYTAAMLWDTYRETAGGKTIGNDDADPEPAGRR